MELKTCNCGPRTRLYLDLNERRARGWLSTGSRTRERKKHKMICLESIELANMA